MELKEKLQMATIILIVIGLGLFALNQFFAWQYKSAFLQKPCELCIKLNPNFERCSADIIYSASQQIYTINWSKMGNLSDLK
jgi:hypothetical protein